MKEMGSVFGDKTQDRAAVVQDSSVNQDFQVSQVQSGRICKRSRHAPKGQRAHSPGHCLGYDEAMKLKKGQKR